ncbi:hypothetical protein MTO96_036253 [Rhipicephalus appendiculatus]
MYALNLGADAARVAEKTTSRHPKKRHRHAKHAVSSVQGGHMTNSSRCQYRFAKKPVLANAAQAESAPKSQSPAKQPILNKDSPPDLDECHYPSLKTSQTPSRRSSRSRSRSRKGQSTPNSKPRSKT